ncbi:2-dehydro-3-deoxygalactonokinase [Nisaea acidiphila]|uniref:2-dehydro-3-deoxygalactonokinase n=1 Tax=Nisaea acidiphila TaxID=1862145 RepID=A0A9J7ANT4_9PROT|nr:2-dehydro-3-deoxygalactonokinase [Nisaea acidiphila]UUX48257.1 2-dehydro-3-deoxygalactonokinase [Nisaea acidiphila]
MLDKGLIALDWGTTWLRAYRMSAEGEILASSQPQAGIGNLGTGDFESIFAAVTKDWLEEAGDDAPVIVLSGMVTSRQGWIESPYAPCPADPRSLAALAIPHETKNGRKIWFSPGLSTTIDGKYDVIRGEEMQILGAVDGLGTGRQFVCLPGTHSKWAVVEDGVILDFRTYMTGELFEATRRHTIIGRMMEHDAWSDSGFDHGLDAAEADRGLLGELFAVRSRTLLNALPVEESGAFLSGLLIGSEVLEAQRLYEIGGEVCIIGNPALTELYVRTLSRHGIRSRQLAETMAAQGMFRFAHSVRERA